MRESLRFWFQCAKLASRGTVAFANDWSWFFGVPVVSFIFLLLASSGPGQSMTGNSILDALLGAATASGLTWLIVFTIRLFRAPAILYREERGRADALQAEKKSKEEKQQVVDELAAEITWATGNLLNRPDGWATDQAAAQLVEDIKTWMIKIETRLGDREHFTGAMQQHFGTSGFINPLTMTHIRNLDHQLSIMSNKFDRLREIISWLQAK